MLVPGVYILKLVEREREKAKEIERREVRKCIKMFENDEIRAARRLDSKLFVCD